MVKLSIDYSDIFKKKFSKIKDKKFQEKIKKQINKIIDYPLIGKPMRYQKKGTRELYIKPYRLVYSYFENELIIIFIDICHKDNQ